MIIDGHVHIGTGSFFHMSADGEFLVRQADAAGFDRLFVTHLAALFYDMREGNDALGKELARFPDRLIGMATIPTPRFGDQAVDEVRRCHETYGMRGVKTYSYPEASIAEPASLPLMELAAELAMPVLVHITPDECDYLMTRVPDVPLVMAHMGGHPWANGDWQRAIAVAAKHPNLLLDTASSQIDNGMLERAVAEIGPERIVFGTDMPLLDPYTQLAKVTGAIVTDEAKALILGGNYQRILGLS
ncbi:MAG: amidohydrolase family protein [Phycisphaerae bacterium]|nr:amidohydrolase family protein [Phycisphaerae bacterium]